MLDRIFLAIADTQNAYGRTSRLTPGPAVDRGLAVVTIRGTLDQDAYADIASQVTAAAATDAREILLRIDSPGGTARGISAAVDAIVSAAKQKRLTTYVDTLCCSAAYWLASGSHRIVAERMALVGSIGTYLVAVDSSKLAADVGLKFHVIRAGKFKGAGTPGTEITAEQLDEFQRLVDGLNSHFLAGVAAGRNLPSSRVAELADGRAHLAADAVRLKLIDAVGSFDSVLSQLQQPVLTAADRWFAAIEKREAAGMTRQAAVRAVMHDQPELREEFVRSANPQQN